MADPVLRAEITATGLRKIVVQHDTGDKEGALRLLEQSFLALAELDRRVRLERAR